ncbi:MAG: hypothetical protein PHG23_01600 [Candidatus Pacebacteria bacterium]|nr:hypothetical protein [Candidatus Paceibacterota bacterium]
MKNGPHTIIDGPDKQNLIKNAEEGKPVLFTVRGGRKILERLRLVEFKDLRGENIAFETIYGNYGQYNFFRKTGFCMARMNTA